MMILLFYPRNFPLKFFRIGSVIDEMLLLLFVVEVEVHVIVLNVVVEFTNLPLKFG